jgi:O-acetyl-ADP-ribose deacetylase (regulator of RNase III)
MSAQHQKGYIVMKRDIEIICGDITILEEVDAIVNAANSSLLGGGGVDGAIHAAAGPRLLEACRALPQVRPGMRCRTGEARLTPGFDLSAKWVIHTVGPVWSGADGDEDELAACYASALRLASEHAIATIAFPAISTGAYGFPVELAAKIAIRELRKGLATFPVFKRVIACCYDEEAEAIYHSLAKRG